MSPGPRRSAAWRITVAVGIENAAAPTVASGAIPVIPITFRSPPISPATAVPWFVSPSDAPTWTPLLFVTRSSWVKFHAHSQSMTRTPQPLPPGMVQA